MPAEPDLARGRRHRGQGRRRPARDGRHLPARPARLGPGLRPADDGGQHVRRHLVRQGLARRGQRPGVQARPPTSTSTWCATHGEKGAPQAGFTECLNNLIQGNVAMWYDATSAAGLARGGRTPRSRARSATPPAPVVKTKQLGLALRLVVEHPAGQHEEGQRLEVHLLGLRQGVRGPGRPTARLVHASRPASAPRPTRTRTTSRWPRRSPKPTKRRHRVRRPGQPRRAAPAGARASSSSTSPSSPTSAPRSPRTSARRSPGR